MITYILWICLLAGSCCKQSSIIVREIPAFSQRSGLEDLRNGTNCEEQGQESGKMGKEGGRGGGASSSLLMLSTAENGRAGKQANRQAAGKGRNEGGRGGGEGR